MCMYIYIYIYIYIYASKLPAVCLVASCPFRCVCVWGGRGYSWTPIHSCPELYALLHTICNICVYSCIYVNTYVYKYIDVFIYKYTYMSVSCLPYCFLSFPVWRRGRYSWALSIIALTCMPCCIVPEMQIWLYACLQHVCLVASCPLRSGEGGGL